MDVSGEHRLAVGPDRVWRELHDADTLRACIPGCEDVQVVTRDQFVGRLMTRVGAISTVFTGRLMVSDEHFPKDWEVSAHAESPSAGWADGSAKIRLSPVSGGTMVSYRIHVEPGGRLAAAGDRLLRGTAMRMANDFFNRLTERLMPTSPPGGDPMDRAAPAATSPHRIVPPLAPTAPAQPLAVEQPATVEPRPAPPTESRAQRIIIRIGWGFCAFILLSMALALSMRV